MNTDSFAQRHIGPRKSDLDKMFKTIGVNSMKELIEETIPENILLEKKLSLDKAMSEQENIKSTTIYLAQRTNSLKRTLD